jgi:hypothetical protein
MQMLVIVDSNEYSVLPMAWMVMTTGVLMNELRNETQAFLSLEANIIKLPNLV